MVVSSLMLVGGNSNPIEFILVRLIKYGFEIFMIKDMTRVADLVSAIKNRKYCENLPCIS